MAALSVTAIIPTFNRAAFLKDALTSILAQTVLPDRILVVDDGSTDATASAVARFGTRVEYLRKNNGGKSSALNLALTQVDTDCVWMFDDDDVAAPEALERLCNGLLTSPECGFAYGSYKMFTAAADGTWTIIDRQFPTVRPEGLFVSLMGRSFIHQPGLLVRRRCYDIVGIFDESMLRSQDYEMILRLARRFRGTQVLGPLFFQRQHAGVRGTASFTVRATEVGPTWKQFDQIILRRLRETCALEEFLPYTPATLPLDGQDRLAALLERSTIVGRRGLWSLAAEDLRAAASVAEKHHIECLISRQSQILHRMFDAFSDGAADFPAAQPFREALNDIGSPTLARDIRLGMSWGLPYQIRLAARAGRFAEVAMLTRIYTQIAPPRIMAMSVTRKLGAKFTRPTASGRMQTRIATAVLQGARTRQ